MMNTGRHWVSQCIGEQRLNYKEVTLMCYPTYLTTMY